jgi:hypothetical protein
MINRYGRYFKLKFEDDLPVITEKDIEANTMRARVIYKNQWASHPSRRDRYAWINELGETLLVKEFEKSWSK